MPMLEVNELSVRFTRYERGLRQTTIETIHKLGLTIDAGEILAVVGASGSGKSLLAHAILGILPGNAQVSGTIRFDGEELTPARQAQLRGRDIADWSGRAAAGSPRSPACLPVTNGCKKAALSSTGLRFPPGAAIRCRLCSRVVERGARL